MAKEYFSIATTLIDVQKVINDTSQLSPSVIEELIQSESYPIQSTTSIDAIHEELRKKPQQLLLMACSVTVLLAGLALFLDWFILLTARTLIA